MPSQRVPSSKALALIALVLSFLFGCGESLEDEPPPPPSADDQASSLQQHSPAAPPTSTPSLGHSLQQHSPGAPPTRKPPEGTLVYDTPEEMTLHVPEIIEGKIGRDSVSPEAMAGSGAQRSEKIRITKSMSVTLCCGEKPEDPFEIIAKSPETQAVVHEELGDDDFTRWEFEVTPLKSGKHSLGLRVIRHFDSGAPFENVHRREIDIQVDGGITTDTAGPVASAGANVLVAGSAIFKGGEQAYKANIDAIRSAAEAARGTAC